MVISMDVATWRTEFADVVVGTREGDDLLEWDDDSVAIQERFARSRCEKCRALAALQRRMVYIYPDLQVDSIDLCIGDLRLNARNMSVRFHTMVATLRESKLWNPDGNWRLEAWKRGMVFQDEVADETIDWS
jgi:hypothetical protein